MRGFNLLYLTSGLLWSRLQNFGCDLNCGHDKENGVAT